MRFFSEKRTANLFEKITGLLGLFLIFASLFTACENFLQGEDVMNEINNAIEYNNARTYDIRVEAIKGTGDIKAPAGEVTSKKVSDVFQIKFEPADDCKFIKWEAVIPDLGKNESPSDYIEFSDVFSIETYVKLKKPKSNILIRPVCPQKLLITKFNNGEAGKVYKRDETISITFNNKISDECKDNILVAIQGLSDELKVAGDSSVTDTSTDISVSKKYFNTPFIENNDLKVFVDRKSGDVADLIPVPEGGTRNISVTLPKEKIYYINKQFSEDIKVFLEEDFKKTYTINSETSDPTKMRFLLDSKTGGYFRVDDVTVSGSEVSYAVGKVLNLQYIPGDSCYFCGWKILRSYKDVETGENRTELVTADKLSESNINISFSYDDESNEWGYNPRSGVAKAKLSINNYTEGEITVEPLCLKLENFKLSGVTFNSESIYPRDSNIVFTFDKNVLSASEDPEDNLFVTIPNLEEDKTAADYFNPLQISNNILSISSKSGSVQKLIPVETTKKVSVEIPARSIYYEVKEADETVKAYLNQNISYAYTINTETVNKTVIFFHIDDKQSGSGSLKIDDVTRDEQTLSYSIGKSFVLKYKLSNDYRFMGWCFTRKYTDETNTVQEEVISDVVDLWKLNLSIKYEEGSNVYGYTAGEKEGVAQATVTVDNYISGTITIEPVVEKIPTGTIILEDNNGKISANNSILGNYNGVSVKLSTTKEDIENIITFSPDTSYEFIKWQVYNKKNNQVFENGQYIKIKNPELENTSYVLVSAPDAGSDIQLAIKPVVAERPQILDCTPSSSGTTLLRRDSTIQILFDYDMDENSIYYTDSELEQLRVLLSLPEGSDVLYDEDDNTTIVNQLLKSKTKQKYYGYVKEGKTYYKNISIRNNSVTIDNPKSIITQQFKEPVFENPRTLTIGIDRKKIADMPGYIQVLVNVGKIEGEVGEGFFYTKDKKVVSMNGYKKWIYRINNELDTTPPSIKSLQLKLAEDSEDEINSTSSNPSIEQTTLSSLIYSNVSTLYLNLNVSDVVENIAGSGLASNFIVSCVKFADNNYITDASIGDSIGKSYNFIIDYHKNDSSSGADFKGELPLTGLDEGVYKLKFTFKDQSGQATVEPADDDSYYYFCYDKTSPFEDMSLPVIITDGEGNGKLKLSWKSPTDTASAWARSKYYDIKTTSIRYKPYGSGDSAYSSPVEISGGTTEKEFTLSGDTRYEFEIKYKDYAGNEEKVFTTNAYTRPDTPLNVALSTEHGTSVTITGDKPNNATYTNVRVRYREKTSSNNGSWTTVYAGTSDISDSEDAGGVQISGLGNGKTYEFEVSSYNIASGKYSTPFKLSNGTLPTFDTIPSVINTYNSHFGDNTTTVPIQYYPPSSNYTKLRVLCSTANTFPNDDTKTKKLEYTKAQITVDSNGRAESTFTGLTAGTNYYYKIEAWYNNEDNKVVTSTRGPYSTKPLAPTNVTLNRVSTNQNGAIDVSWTNPSGNYSSIVLCYKNSTESSYHTISITDTSATRYSITGLTGGYTYSVYAYAISNGKTSENSASSSVQLYPNAATNFSVTKGSSISEAKVSWTKPTGSYTKLILYKSTTSNFTSSTTTTSEYTYSNSTTQASFTGLSQGQTYYFKLKSYINDTLYNETSAVSYSTDIESVSNASVSSVNASKIRVIWKNPSVYDGIRIYRGSTLIKTIEKSSMSSYLWSSSNSTYYYEDNSLTPNTQYSYSITSYKNVSGTEKTASLTVGSARTYSAVVTSLSATTQSSSSVKLTWTNPTSTSYWNYTYIYYQKAGGSETLYTYWSGKSTTSYTLTGLEGGTNYTFWVKTTDADGRKNSNTSVTATTSPATVTNPTCSPASTSSITLSWTKPAGLYDRVNIYYKKYNDSDYTYYSYYTTGTSCTVTGLSAYTTYNFKFETTKSGLTASSTTITGYTKTNAPAVSVTDSGTNYLTVSVIASYNNGSVLYYKKHSDSSWSSISLGTSYSVSRTISGLTEGTKYDIYATSCYYSANNTSASSTIDYVTSLTTPSNVYATVYEGDTIVHWDKPAGNENYFRIYYKKNSDSTWADTGWQLLGSGSNQYKITGLTANTKYDFKVKSNYDYSEASSYYSSSNNDISSSESSVCSLYTPPAPVTNASLWSDDGMGTVIVRYTPSTSTNYVDVFVNDVYNDTGYKAKDSTGYCYWTVKIPDYKRGSTYNINIRAYHRNNSTSNNAGENYFTKYADNTLSKSTKVQNRTDGYWVINGVYYMTGCMYNVITSTKTFTKNDSSTSSVFYGNGSATVTLSPYSIGGWEVCQDMYQAVMGNNPSSVTGYYDYPVTNVSWYAAIAFCNKLSVLQGLQPCYEISGYSDSDWKNFTYSSVPVNNDTTWNAVVYHFDRNGYHLPTEWQWECAARGGDQSLAEWNYTYSGSNTGDSVAWLSTNSGGTINRATKKSKNRLGLYDMSGNVGEWVSDWYYGGSSNGAYGTTSYTDPYVQCTQSASSHGPASNASSTYYKQSGYTNTYGYKERDWWSPYKTFSYIGFRVCRNKTYNK